MKSTALKGKKEDFLEGDRFLEGDWREIFFNKYTFKTEGPPPHFYLIIACTG